jgi:tetratricopeptide (TPR) repeat protein
VFPFDVRDGVRLLNLTRRLVIARPGGGGSPDPMDRFEVAIHRAAVSVLFQVPDEAKVYLLDIEGRLASARKTPAGALLVARLDLARALLVETRTRPIARDSTREVVVVSGGNRAAPVPVDADRLDRQRLIEAFTALRTSFQDSEVAAEVSIRRGFIAHRLDQHVEALTLLDAGLRQTRDSSVQHWGWLFRGRVLQQTGRLDEAAESYERAVANDPLAQTAATALAAVRLLQDRRAEAERWAQAARTTPVTHVDPWWEYWYGDQRFLPALLAEIRGAHP